MTFWFVVLLRKWSCICKVACFKVSKLWLQATPFAFLLGIQRCKMRSGERFCCFKLDGAHTHTNIPQSVWWSWPNVQCTICTYLVVPHGFHIPSSGLQDTNGVWERPIFWSIKMTRAFCSQDAFASFIGQICSCRNTAVEKRNKTACYCASRSDWVFMEEITASKQQASFNLNVLIGPVLKQNLKFPWAASMMHIYTWLFMSGVHLTPIPDFNLWR